MAKRSKRNLPANRPAARQPGRSHDFIWGALLFAAVLLAYSPVWRAGFVWDDDVNITSNPCIIGPLGLKEIWTTSAAQFYPLVLTTFWVEHSLWGLWPLPYHLVNVFLHGVCAIVLWRILRRLRVPGAWLGAALWALHPVQVESVAWVTELKNTQSGLFFLLSILFFVRHLNSPRAAKSIAWDWNYALTMLFAVLAITSKSSTVILPLVLCLCAWWKEGRWQWRNLVKVAPVIPVSIAASALTLWTQVLAPGSHPALDPRLHTWQAHLVAAGEGFWFYLGKLIWPYPLIIVYPDLEIRTGEALSYLPFLAILIFLFILGWKRTSWARPWFFVFAYFLAAVLPELEFAGWYIGDHFEYLGSMGPLALAGAVLVGWGRPDSAKRRLGVAFGIGILCVFGILTWRESMLYQNEEALWTYTLERNPRAWAAHNELGNVLFKRGDVDEAIAHYQESVQINPNFDDAHSNLAVALLQKGDADGAINEAERAVQLDPNFAAAYNNLGNALEQKGRRADAMVEYEKALAINPYSDRVQFNLSNALIQEGKIAEAIAGYQKALQINPAYVEAFNNLGLAQLQAGEPDEAIDSFKKGLAVKPDFDVLHFSLGNALAQQGQLAEAMAEYRRALELNPNYAEAHNGLGLALARAGRNDEAKAEFEAALRVKPDYPDAASNLARMQGQN